VSHSDVAARARLEQRQQASQVPAGAELDALSQAITTNLRRLSQNAYVALELNPAANISEIKRAFRRITRKYVVKVQLFRVSRLNAYALLPTRYNPDSGPGLGALFQAILRAYNTLSDPRTRSLHDTRWIRHGGRPPASGVPPFQSLVLTTGTRTGKRQRPASASVRVAQPLTFPARDKNVQRPQSASQAVHVRNGSVHTHSTNNRAPSTHGGQAWKLQPTAPLPTTDACGDTVIVDDDETSDVDDAFDGQGAGGLWIQRSKPEPALQTEQRERILHRRRGRDGMERPASAMAPTSRASWDVTHRRPQSAVARRRVPAGVVKAKQTAHVHPRRTRPASAALRRQPSARLVASAMARTRPSSAALASRHAVSGAVGVQSRQHTTAARPSTAPSGGRHNNRRVPRPWVQAPTDRRPGGGEEALDALGHARRDARPAGEGCPEPLEWKPLPPPNMHPDLDAIMKHHAQRPQMATPTGGAHNSNPTPPSGKPPPRAPNVCSPLPPHSVVLAAVTDTTMTIQWQGAGGGRIDGVDMPVIKFEATATNAKDDTGDVDAEDAMHPLALSSQTNQRVVRIPACALSLSRVRKRLGLPSRVRSEEIVRTTQRSNQGGALMPLHEEEEEEDEDAPTSSGDESPNSAQSHSPVSFAPMADIARATVIVDSIDRSVHTCTFRGLRPSQRYLVRVRAFSAAGRGSFSSTVTEPRPIFHTISKLDARIAKATVDMVTRADSLRDVIKEQTNEEANTALESIKTRKLERRHTRSKERLARRQAIVQHLTSVGRLVVHVNHELLVLLELVRSVVDPFCVPNSDPKNSFLQPHEPNLDPSTRHLGP